LSVDLDRHHRAQLDENAYWRCSACGEVWNASRRGTASGGGYR
jgi:hypothetical protein